MRFNRMFIQTLIPLYRATDQKSPTTPESSERGFVFGAAVAVGGAECAAELFDGEMDVNGDLNSHSYIGTVLRFGEGKGYRKPERSYKVPKPNMPP